MRLGRLVFAIFALSVGSGPSRAASYEDVWPELQRDIFGAKEIGPDNGVIALDAPVRAEDAALVPITIRMPAATATTVKKVTLVVDKNPTPVAAEFAFGEAAGDGDRALTTRIRINRYTFIRAIAETQDGKLFMATKFVKAAGGCSAPFGKDYETALEGLGTTRIKTIPASSTGLVEAQVMIRHPSFTGMQIDPMTRVTPPARFVEELEVKAGGRTVFRMNGGITISEDPNFRFTYSPGSVAGPIEVSGKDTQGAVISGKSSSDGS